MLHYNFIIFQISSRIIANTLYLHVIFLVMKIVNLVVIIIVSIVLASCGNGNKPLAEKNKALSEISEKEKKLMLTDEPNADVANEMIELYKNYVEKYPDDSIAPEFLYKAVEIAMNFGRAYEAIEFLDIIERSYENFDKYPAIFFLKAYIYENHIHDINKATDCYTIFLEKYPNHELAKDAEAALIFIGIDDAELIKLFEQNE